MNTEAQQARYRQACIKLESTVKINSNCRHARNLISCFQCDIYESCKSNNYDTKLAAKKRAGENLTDSKAWEIDKKVRNH